MYVATASHFVVGVTTDAPAATKKRDLRAAGFGAPTASANDDAAGDVDALTLNDDPRFRYRLFDLLLLLFLRNRNKFDRLRQRSFNDHNRFSLTLPWIV